MDSKTILVLTDFSEKAEKAAEFAYHIGNATGYSILLYHFFELSQTFPSESGIFAYYDDGAAKAEIFDALEKLAGRLNSEYLESHNQEPPKVSWNCEAAPLSTKLEHLIQNKNIWLIVMGDQSEDIPINRFLFGNESHVVIEEATCPVMLVPEDFNYHPISKMVFASELDESESEGLEFLKELSKIWKSRIHSIHITDQEPGDPSIADLEARFNYLKSGNHEQNISYELVFGNDIAQTLNTYADEQNADMLVLIHKKRSKIKQLLHHSISKAMMNFHQSPILILQK